MHSGSRVTGILCLITGSLFANCSVTAPSVPRRESPPAQWEEIASAAIDDAARLSNIRPLRESALGPNDFEIRIWRGFGLEELEGVILRRAGGMWSARLIVVDSKVTSTKITWLNAPKSGWGPFWHRFVELGVLDLPGAPLDDNCFGHLDGTSHVVEISKDGVYRTYLYPSGVAKCQGSQDMDIIAETVAEEFYDGSGKCLTAEWFPCAESLRKHRLEQK